VAPTDTTVLIEGETGVGKELVARAVHDASPRKDRPLIKVNCAAIPAGLLESELFGHTRGAFTGADRDRKGRFQLADGGTLFLDEIGELPLELQPKLLRVLEEGEFTPLGGSRTLKVDVRVIATTNRELKREMAAGNFRQDLYHRLSTYPVTIPPLRKRKGDIQPLVEAFVERFARKLGKQINQVPREVMDALCAYPWPGNVRELRNVIERAVIGTDGPVLRLAEDLRQLAAEASRPSGALANLTLEQAERTHITAVLRECNWRIEGESGAARRLDINPSTLRNRIKKLRIERPS
jgi:transcriptional regulator with GAF, ATPase, and Fis domain